MIFFTLFLRFLKRSNLIVFEICLICLFSSFFFSCASIPDIETVQDEVGSALPSIKMGERAKDSKMAEEELISYVEQASYKALKKVVDTVLSHPSNLKSDDKLYLYLAINFLQLLYPYTKEMFKVPQFSISELKEGSKKKSYVECFEALKQHKYLYDTKKDDFLSVILPTLFIIQNEIPTLYKNDIEERLQKAKRMNSSSPLPHYLMGIFYERGRMSGRAKESYRKAIATDESFYPAIIKYAKLCNNLSRFDEAIKMLNFLPKEYAETDEVRLLTAFAHLGRQDGAAATPYVEKILSEQVEEGEALFERVRLLIERHEYMKANSLLNIYTVKNKTNKDYLLLKMRIAKEWNKNEKVAKQYAEQAYKYYPDNFDVISDCAALLLDLNEGVTDEAMEGRIGGKTVNDLIGMLLKIEKDNIKI